MLPATTRHTQVHCAVFLLNFKEIWSSSKDFHKSSQLKISRKSVQLEPRCYMRIGGRTDGHEEPSRLCHDCTNEYKVSVQKIYKCDKHFINKAASHQGRPQWSRILRRESKAPRLMGLRVRIPTEEGGGDGYLFVVSVVLSDRGLCDELIIRPEEFYRLWCVSV